LSYSGRNTAGISAERRYLHHVGKKISEFFVIDDLAPAPYVIVRRNTTNVSIPEKNYNKVDTDILPVSSLQGVT
jgi:hypothetical protein